MKEADSVFQYIDTLATMLHSPPQHARMHRLFLIQELLSIICEHVRDEPSSIAGRTLASLARTSKVFYHVATSALWSQLNGLAPLLQPLASDLITEDAAVMPARPRRPLMLRRPLKMAEWETLWGFARRVQHLYVHDPTRPVDVSIIRTLCNPPTTSPVFPNLKSIIWNDERAETFSFIRTLSGPTVTSLTINISNDSRIWHITELGILASLPYLCPNVTRVTLPTNAFCHNVSTISEALCAWSNLTEIKCGAIDGTTLAHLAKQSTLRKLSFDTPSNMRLGLDVTLPSGAFSCVRDFEIHTANLSFLCAFLNKLGGSPVSLHMLVDTNPPPTCVSSLFTTLRRFSSTRLQSLSLRLMTPSSPRVTPVHAFPYPQLQANTASLMAPPINMMAQLPHGLSLYAPLPPHPFNVMPMGIQALSYGSPPTFHTLTLLDFMPLSFFESLGRIDIDVNHGIHLSDDDLRSLISSWPHLYSFSLNDNTGWRVKSGITQIGLLAMLEFCPNLQKLCIALNTDAFTEVPSDRPGEGFENIAVQTLGLADSLIDVRATVAVAAFLSDIFPNLTTIVAWDSVPMSRRLNAGIYAERWTHVSEQVRGMNRVREQERKWWMSDDEGESEACALSQV
ncbi:uncharacterized protein EDB91DRAFT_1339311 [Suillus paluster]|uniref:uncharacterized protein n=1 Tax=Suillus paluster TaxID=48578 RepID=UPI001B86905D|nr:uncharacterized protein EDB91DRAFT_1339311 [Suillus paluster]KAG1728151.1 hypothetical protein EDB91DRAFT_1339311 [Suillus paluster]